MDKSDIQRVMNSKLGLDDTFDFKCQECGRCCHNRYGLLFTPYDVFRIARHLNRSPADIINKHCKVHIGETSHLPMVEMKPKINDGVCQFLRKGKCMVHQAKPVVCAVYPLGKANDKDGNTFYFLLEENTLCGEKGELHTVRQWLHRFGIDSDECDIFGKELGMLLASTGTFILKNEKRLTKDNLNLIYKAYMLLYVNYNTAKEFLPQFRENSLLFQKTLSFYGYNIQNLEGGNHEV